MREPETPTDDTVTVTQPQDAQPGSSRPPANQTLPHVSVRQARQSRAPDAEARLNPHVAVNLVGQLAKTGRRHLTGLGAIASLDEQQRLATQILRRFGTLALQVEDPGAARPGQRLSASARKNFAVAWGIASDKLTILQGRPTQIIRHEETEAQRPAVWELVERLASIRKADASA